MTKVSSAKTVLVGISGTALQWYDFALFGYFSPIIASTYFPNTNHTAALLSAFAVLAVGYLLAPLGAMVFGYIGDRLGRKRALTLSILAMAIPTAMISLVPSYRCIGVLAPIIITLLRVIQGFVASAEYTGSTIFLVEHAPANKKAFFGCLSSSSYSLGYIAAGLVASFFTSSLMPAWAWRLGFGLALLGGLLVFFMRRLVKETPEFQTILEHEKHKHPFLAALKETPLAFIGVIGITGMVGIMTMGSYVFCLTYINTYFHISLGSASLIISAALLLDALVEPFVAMIADKLGFRPVILFGIFANLILTIPLFQLIATAQLGLIILAILSLSLIIAITCASLNAYMLGLFPKQYRYSGYGIAFHLGMSAFGATAPWVMLWLVAETNNLIAPAWYYVFGSCLGLVSLMLCELSKERGLRAGLVPASRM